MTGIDAFRGALPELPTVGGRGAKIGDGESPAAEGADFSATLHEAVRQVSALQADADAKALALARGEPVQVHDVLIAMGKSEIAFNLALEVRNRLIQAWETLARTAV